MDRQQHILVVDDDLEIRDLLQEYLTRNGYRTTAVGEGSGDTTKAVYNMAAQAKPR